YQVVSPDDAEAVQAEVNHQLKSFRELMGRDPSHLDSHQHVHRDQPVRSVLRVLGRQLNKPVRHFSPRIRYCHKFYGQTIKGEPYADGIQLERLLSILHELTSGVTELGCHPGLDAELNSMYRLERVLEVQTLCDPKIKDALRLGRIELRSFADLPK